eukprot:395818-Amphidinium_carterae.1
MDLLQQGDGPLHSLSRWRAEDMQQDRAASQFNTKTGRHHFTSWRELSPYPSTDIMASERKAPTQHAHSGLKGIARTLLPASSLLAQIRGAHGPDGASCWYLQQ